MFQSNFPDTRFPDYPAAKTCPKTSYYSTQAKSTQALSTQAKSTQ